MSENYREYFPTKALRIAEMRLCTLLKSERDRLDALAFSLKRECAICSDNLASELPHIVDFTFKYHKLYKQYLDAVLPQQPKKIRCKPSCGNCCHHYPMSVEPFELISLYVELRKRTDLLTIIEACEIRSRRFLAMFENSKQKLKESKTFVEKNMDLHEMAEDLALHDYFAAWVSCPFSDKAGDCLVYPFRPVSCRMYFSETAPEFCTPKYLETEKNGSYIVYMPDVAEDAVYGISEHYSELSLPESFFGGLLAVNAFEGIMSQKIAGNA